MMLNDYQSKLMNEHIEDQDINQLMERAQNSANYEEAMVILEVICEETDKDANQGNQKFSEDCGEAKERDTLSQNGEAYNR